MYEKIESTSWKWLNIKNPLKQLIGFMLALIIALVVGFVSAIYAVANAKNDVITSLRSDKDDLQSQLDESKKRERECADARVERAEKGFDKVSGLSDKVNELKEKIRK